MQIQRVVIADDHAIVRRALADLLAAYDGVELVEEAEHGIDAIAAVKVHQPDLLFLDVSMPYVGGLEIIGEIRQWSPATRIAVFTGVRSGGVINALLDDGVQGLLLKSCTPEELHHGLAALLRGERYVCTEALELANASGSLSQLTARERQVLQQIVRGASNQEIAERFNISAKTVENHRTNLMRKLDAHSLGALIQIALREGLLAGDGQDA